MASACRRIVANTGQTCLTLHAGRPHLCSPEKPWFENEQSPMAPRHLRITSEQDTPLSKGTMNPSSQIPSAIALSCEVRSLLSEQSPVYLSLLQAKFSMGMGARFGSKNSCSQKEKGNKIQSLCRNGMPACDRTPTGGWTPPRQTLAASVCLFSMPQMHRSFPRWAWAEERSSGKERRS